MLTDISRCYKTILPLLAAALCLTQAHDLSAAQSTIKILTETTQSVVMVESEVGGVFGQKSKPYYVPELRSIVIRSKVVPLKYDRNGAGIIIDSTGRIATNYHTVNQAGRITVTFFNGQKTEAKIVHTARENDLAIIEVVPSFPLRPIQFADSDNAKLGQVVFSIGNSRLIKNTISEGEITALGQKRNPAESDDKNAFLQMNFGLYKGDSGTPVLDKDGKLLGIITAANRSAESTTYAITSNSIKQAYLEFSEKSQAVPPAA